MNITEVHVRLHSCGKLRAFASITIDHWLVVRGLKIIEKSTGDLFVAMPSRDDNGKDICHPVHQKGRDYLTEQVVQRFREVEASRSLEIGEERALIGPEQASV